MTTIFSLVNVDPDEYTTARTMGEQVLREATQRYLMLAQETMAETMGLHVDGTTENHTEMFTLPMVGEMQKTVPGADVSPVRVKGNWSVGYPLHQFEVAVAGTDVEFAYMSPQQFSDHVRGVFAKYANTVRNEALRAIFNNSNATFSDEHWGSLTIRRLANADGTTYPPIVGSDTLRTGLDLYEAAGYASISDANNPYTDIQDVFTDSFGYSSTGGVFSYISRAQRANTEALASFIPVNELGIRSADNQEYLVGFGMDSVPLSSVAGRVIGAVGDVVISVWEYIPDGYIYSTSNRSSAPLAMRVDPAFTGLGAGGLQMLENPEDPTMDFFQWRARFGFGVRNRLNGHVMQLTAGSYSVPTEYA